jgi:hypothetical protein
LLERDLATKIAEIGKINNELIHLNGNNEKLNEKIKFLIA